MGKYTRGLMLALYLLVSVPAVATELEGRLDWVNRVALSIPVSGVIHEVGVETGARVKKGTVLAKLDPRPFALHVRAARARLKSRKLQRDEAQRELGRARELYERTLLSDHDLQLATIGYETAEADYQLAVASLKQAELDREYSTLRAPFNAIVVQRLAVVGQTVAASMQPPVLFVLADGDHMRVRAVVGTAQLGDLHVGDEVRIQTGGRTYPGRLVFVAREPAGEGSPAAPRYEVVFEFAVDAGTLHVGQAAQVTLP
ncbi:MAG TPA: efflux RND transporter periplasmic adaptor subunit [Gammaproteobacteria bacterium]|nr:efflux RND transporter periplasmic adaptor subunit [Gammaproteobacteria bacterium]